MKRVIFVGNIGSGKTTLSQVIHGKDIEYAKTQMVTVWGDDIVDTPGEYLEAGYMKGVLNVTAAEARIIGLVCSAPEPRNKFSPGYGGSFAKDVIGIGPQKLIKTQIFVEIGGYGTPPVKSEVLERCLLFFEMLERSLKIR